MQIESGPRRFLLLPALLNLLVRHSPRSFDLLFRCHLYAEDVFLPLELDAHRGLRWLPEEPVLRRPEPSRFPCGPILRFHVSTRAPPPTDSISTARQSPQRKAVGEHGIPSQEVRRDP